MKRSSRNRLNQRHFDLFPGDNLFDKIARAVCEAGCLPRKELYEAWEVARRVRRQFTGKRVFDLACGHGLLAQIMVILDHSIPVALAVDKSIPESATTLARTLGGHWPQLKDRVQLVSADIVQIKPAYDDLIISIHACGTLSDQIIDMAINTGASIALLPCCHNFNKSDSGALEGWMDGSLAIDATRVARLRASGYQVTTQKIPGDITFKNRLLIANKS